MSHEHFNQSDSTKSKCSTTCWMKVPLGKTKLMVSGSEGEMLKSNINPCGMCGKKVVENSMLCRRLIHARCANVKRVKPSMAWYFIYESSKKRNDEMVVPVEELCDGIETVKGFSYLGDKGECQWGIWGSSDGKSKNCWMKISGELLIRQRFPLRIKGKICVKSAMLYGSETWACEKMKWRFLRWTERSVVRAICGVKLMDRKNMKELMDMLGLEDMVDTLAKANGVQCYGNVKGWGWCAKKGKINGR